MSVDRYTLRDLTAEHMSAVQARSDAHTAMLAASDDDDAVRDAYVDACDRVDIVAAAIARHLEERDGVPSDVPSQTILPSGAVAPLRLSDVSSKVPADPLGAHTVVRGRNKHGATSRVVRRGHAPVIGALDRDANGAPIVATSDDVHTLDPAAAMARALLAAADDGTLRRVRGGWRATDVTRSTYGIGDHDIPVPIGSDAASWEQMLYVGLVDAVATRVDAERHVNLIDRFDYEPRDIIISGRRRIRGTTQAITVRHADTIDRDTVVTRRARVPYTVKRQPRVRIGLGRGKRSADPVSVPRPGILRAVSDPFTAPTLAQAIRWEILAPSDDREHRFVGHRKVTRPSVKVPRGNRARRTVATDAPIGTVSDVVDALRNGGRATLRGARYRYTVTRSSDRFTFRAVDADGTAVVVKRGLRSAAGTASRIASIDARGA